MTHASPVRFLIALAIAAAWAAPRAEADNAPTPAPSVTLHAIDGSQLRLADLTGHVVLVDFWASWCPPCRTSFPELDSLYRALHARGLDVLAVNVDERRRDADGFLADRPHTMPVFLDPKGQAAQAFHIAGMPTSVLIDRSGHVRFTHTGYTTVVADAYRREIAMLLEEAPHP
jgi:thiol-disulfide isomerase/thioredoxin